MVARMVAGIDVIMYRPDDELRRLARLAVDFGVDDLFAEGCSADAVLHALTERGEAGKRWLEAFDSARDPWFHGSTGAGLSPPHRPRNHHPTVPLPAPPRHLPAVPPAGAPHRPR